MTKQDLLEYLATAREVDAHDVAQALDVDYPTAAMALLRLVRQGLAHRTVDSNRGVYAYALSDRGYARLTYFAEGENDMKHTKLHSGTYHCPACFIEVDLVAEENLKCDQCEGPLAKGPLDEIWDDDEEDEDE